MIKKANFLTDSVGKKLNKRMWKLFEFCYKNLIIGSYSLEDKKKKTMFAIAINETPKWEDISSPGITRRRIFKPLKVFVEFLFDCVRFLFDFFNGLYYGYPTCCVLNFSYVCRSQKSNYDFVHQQDVDAIKANKNVDLGYVPCTKCFNKLLTDTKTKNKP